MFFATSLFQGIFTHFLLLNWRFLITSTEKRNKRKLIWSISGCNKAVAYNRTKQNTMHPTVANFAVALSWKKLDDLLLNSNKVSRKTIGFGHYLSSVILIIECCRQSARWWSNSKNDVCDCLSALHHLCYSGIECIWQYVNFDRIVWVPRWIESLTHPGKVQLLCFPGSTSCIHYMTESVAFLLIV